MTNNNYKIALIRTASNEITLGNYNIQEIGLAKSLIRYNISTDIFARFTNVDDIIYLNNSEYSTIRLIPLKGYNVYKEIMFYPRLIKDIKRGSYNLVQLLDDSQMMIPLILFSLKKYDLRVVLWQGMYRDFNNRFSLTLQNLYDALFSKLIDNLTEIKIAKTIYAKNYLLSKGYRNVMTLPVGLSNPNISSDIELESTIKVFRSKYKSILLYIGVIDKRRDVQFLIELMKSLENDIGLIIVGDGCDAASAKLMINDLGLYDRVLHFERIRNELLSILYNNSNIFLLPTKYEIVGMVVLEALYFGVPVISTPEAGPNEILKNEILGTCISFVKTKWIKQIHYYLKNHNSQKDRQLRQNYIHKYYSWEKIGKQYFYRVISSSTIIQD